MKKTDLKLDKEKKYKSIKLIKMKNLGIRPISILFILCFPLLIISCNKKEINLELNYSKQKELFFGINENLNVDSKNSIELLKQKLNTPELLNNYIDKYGYPKWEKLFRLENNSAILIPIKKASENYFTSYAIIDLKTNKILTHNQNDYNNYSFEKSNQDFCEAERFALQFMELNYETLGISEFTILDRNLFSNTISKKGDVKTRINFHHNNSPSKSNKTISSVTMDAGEWIYTELCFDVSTAAASYHCTKSGSCLSGICDGCNLCVSTTNSITTFCNGSWSYNGSGGPVLGGGNESLGGGGGGEPTGAGFAWIPTLEEVIAITDQLNSIKQLGDSYDFYTTVPSNSPYFSSVSGFAAFKNSIENSINFEFSQVPDLPTNPGDIVSDEVKVRMSYTDYPSYGIKFKLQSKKNANNKFDFESITSSEYGLTASWTWEQDSNTNITTTANEIIINVSGDIKYNVFLEGLGTIYRSNKKYTIKISRSTGKIIYISKN